MNHIALLLGMIKLGNLIRLDNEKFDQKKLDKLANKAGKILEDRSKLKPSFMNSLYFSSMKSIIKKNEAYFEYESRYWKEAGWLTKNFKQINQVV